MKNKKSKKKYFVFNEKRENSVSEEDLKDRRQHNRPSRWRKKITRLDISNESLSLDNNIDEESFPARIMTSVSDSSYTTVSSDSSSGSESSDSSYGDLEYLHLNEWKTKKRKGKTVGTCSDKTGTNVRSEAMLSKSTLSSYSKTNSSNFSADSLFNISNNSKDEEIIDEHTNLYNNCLKLFSLNAFLYNDMYRYNPHLYGMYENCRNNKRRCENIGDLCLQYDLIFLRSVYGIYQKQLYDKLKFTHTVLLDHTPPNSFNFMNDLYYFFQNYLGGNGGLFIAWKKRIFRLVYYDSMFLTSDLLVKRKVIKVIKLIYKEKHNLYFIHTEFDLYQNNNKESNLNDLIMILKKTLWKMYLFHFFYSNKKILKIRKKESEEEEEEDEANSSQKKNQNKKEKDSNNVTHVKFKNGYVYIVGSFNIDQNENRELYRQLINLKGYGKLKDIFFYKNINYKIQRTYNIVERDNTLVGGLNYCFGKTDNIFMLEKFRLKKEDIAELIYFYDPIEVIKEKLNKLQKDPSKYDLYLFFSLINKNEIVFKFQEMFNFGVDIITQKKHKELSDHWPLSAKLLVKHSNSNFNLQIENCLFNFIRNVDIYFHLQKMQYDPLCEVSSILHKNGSRKKKHQEERIEKYDYSKKCIITHDNMRSFHVVDKRLKDIIIQCFEDE